jgi:S1-C subfamily serine protease
MLTLEEQHQRILYPVVRIKTDKAGGSGTVIYSKKNPDKGDEYQSFILTCAHVIDDAITTKKEWDGLLKKKVEREFLQQVSVEVFDYVYTSHVNSSNSHRANIVAYDKYHDIAILKLDSPKEVEFVAKIVDRDKISSIKIFTKVFASGCSLLHDPFPNEGMITYLNEDIDNKLYFMNNADSIFGNSGGAIFLAETGEQLGITARVTVMQLGFSVDIQTWMNFCVAPQRIYEFLDEQELKFLYDETDTYAKAMKRRAKKEKEAKLMQVAKDDEDEEKEQSTEVIPKI